MADVDGKEDHIEAREEASKARKAVAITSGTIDVTSLSSFVADDAAGAIATFVGTTRDSFQGKRTLRLEYEAYEPMAVRAIEVTMCFLS
jgi:molybdopterin synthase catalytic subunit